MKIKEFNRANAQTILAEAEAALQSIAAKYGLNLAPKGRSFRRDQLPVMFQFVLKASGETIPAAQVEWNQYAASLGLEPGDFGREFTSNGKRWKIAGIRPDSPKYPIVASRVGGSGKLYKFTVGSLHFADVAKPKPKRTGDEILADMRRVEAMLSPENLTCDGELSRTQVARRRAALNTEYRELVREFGRRPTDAELLRGAA